MKKPIYYTLTDYRFERPQVIAVTSEGPRGRINGRYQDGAPTHTTSDKCIGRFDKVERAVLVVDEVAAIRKRNRPLIEEAMRILRDKQADERREIDAYIKSMVEGRAA